MMIGRFVVTQSRKTEILYEISYKIAQCGAKVQRRALAQCDREQAAVQDRIVARF